MGKQPREKMSRADRAKQFAPFDALKGLRLALYLKEYEKDKVERGEVQIETAEKISKTLFELKPHEIVWCKFYDNGYYKEATGVSKINLEKRCLKVGERNIPIDDIFDIMRKNENPRDFD